MADAQDKRTPREIFLTRQSQILDARFSLTSGEESARQEFEQLAIDTFEELEKAGRKRSGAFHIWPKNASNFIHNKKEQALIPDSIVERWKKWNDNYPDLVARNHRLALRDTLSDLSEMYDSSSFPRGYEDKIREWVDLGQFQPFPVYFRRKKSEELRHIFEELRRLRKQCGGWLYYDEGLGKVVFKPDSLKNYAD